jgi:hypothetical protein
LGCERLRLPHFQTFCSQMAARLSALRACLFLPPERFLVLIYVRRPSGHQGHSAAVRIRSLEKIHLKKSISSGTRTGDLRTCSMVPQPTTLPRPQSTYIVPFNIRIFCEVTKRGLVDRYRCFDRACYFHPQSHFLYQKY